MPSEFNLGTRKPTYSLFLSILDAPVLHKDNVGDADSILKAFVPNEVTDPELFQLVTNLAANIKVETADTILKNFS